MIKRFTQSLRAKLILVAILVEIVMLSALIVNSLRLSETHLLAQAKLRIEQVIPLLKASLTVPLIQNDYATLQDILNEARNEQSLNYLVLFNRRGTIIAHAGWDLRQPLPPLDQEIAFTQQQLFNTQLPIELGGHQYGTLRFGVSTTFLAQAKTRLLDQSIFIAALEVALSVLILASISYWLTRHLSRLTEASRRLAEGQFDTQVAVTTRDEVGQLAQAFNFMAQGIKSRMNALTNTQTALVEAIESLKKTQIQKEQYLVQVQEERARLKLLLSTMNTGILFVDDKDHIIYYNPFFLTLWRIPENAHLIGKKREEVIDISTYSLQPSRLSSGKSYEINLLNKFEIQREDGRTLTQICYPIYDNQNHRTGYLWVYEDVTQERETAAQLTYLAERDPITGLFNRRRFQDELQRMLAEAERRHSNVALLFFDLDEFKYINDNFGHGVGDATLVRVVNEVGTQIRRSELFSRLGGDEFAVLVPNATEIETRALAERIVRCVSQIPLNYQQQNIKLTSSLGVAFYPQHGLSAEELVAHADAAMYQAKRDGKNAWRIYRADRDESRHMIARMNWNDRIAKALEENRMRLFFQGIYNAETGVLSNLEVLVRMIDEQDLTHFIMPNYFIPMAEKSGKIVDIDSWVIHESIKLLAGSENCPALSVNISGRSVDEPTLPDNIAKLLTRYNVDPTRLRFELTETSAISDLHDAQRFIESLHAIGCHVSLDDFGSGFASFAYLKHLKTDTLKIDGLFIRNLPKDHDNQVFVKAIIDVSHSMKKTVTAEFVEDLDTLSMLQSFHIDKVQGYYLDIPKASYHEVRRYREPFLLNR